MKSVGEEARNDGQQMRPRSPGARLSHSLNYTGQLSLNAEHSALRVCARVRVRGAAEH